MRPTTVNTFGNPESTFGTAVASTSCRLDPLKTPIVDSVADRAGAITRYQLTLLYDEDIQDGDRVVIGAITYEMIELHDNHTDNMFKRAIVSQIVGGV